MPELPEVETIKRQLRQKIIAKRIRDAIILYPPLIKERPPDDFRGAVSGNMIKGVDRISKYLLIHLENDLSILMHLKMTGQLLFKDKAQTRDRHTHLIIIFDDGTELHYRDVRKFGRLKLVAKDILRSQRELCSLGVETLRRSYDLEKIGNELKKRKTTIKATLLRQDLICGLGNIYIDEALFAAGISPGRKSSKITKKELLRLIDSINRILRKAIANRGTSIRDFVDVNGERGQYQDLLEVYGREGEQCLRCGTVIERIKLASRSTFYCRECQS